MKRKLPRKIKKAAKSIYTVFTPDVVEENRSGNEYSAIINTKIEYKTKTGRMTNTMRSAICRMESERADALRRGMIKKMTERRICFDEIIEH